MPTTTRQTIRQDAAKLLGALVWTGTASGGSATTLVDTGDGGLRDTGFSSSFFAGTYVLLTSGADSGQWRMVTATGYAPTTGTLTVGEGWPTGPSAGVTYEIYTMFPPDVWNTLVNDALAKLRYRTRTPLSLVTDADMETSGVADWSVSSATRAKITSGSFVTGTQALQVTNSGLGGYAQSANIPCNPRSQFTAWVDYQAVAGTARLRLWDVTNGASLAADIGPDQGVNNEGGMITVSATTPATCRNVALRLIGDEATAIINWDNAIVMRSSRRRYALPSWIEEADQIAQITRRIGVRLNDFMYVDAGFPLNIEQDWAAVTPWTVVLPSGAPHPYYIDAERPFSSLSTDAATTVCPLQLAKYATAAEALLRLTPELEAMANQRNLSLEKAEIFRMFTQLKRRLQPQRPRPIGPKAEWVATA